MASPSLRFPPSPRRTLVALACALAGGGALGGCKGDTTVNSVNGGSGGTAGSGTGGSGAAGSGGTSAAGGTGGTGGSGTGGTSATGGSGGGGTGGASAAGGTAGSGSGGTAGTGGSAGSAGASGAGGSGGGPPGGSWAAGPPMNARRQGHTAVLLQDGRVLVFGGTDGVDLATAEVFDPAANAGAGSWTTVASMSTSRRGSLGAVLMDDGRVFVSGGAYLGDSSTPAELFDPDAAAGLGAWIPIGPSTSLKFATGAVLLPSGRVLLAGGSSHFNDLRGGADVWDPLANGGQGLWTPVTMPFGTGDPVLVTLPSGKVLAAGDAGASAALFDPAAGASGAWSAAFAVPGPAIGAPAFALLASGLVLSCGGSIIGVERSEALLYDPSVGATGAFTALPNLAAPRMGHGVVAVGGGAVVIGGFSAQVPSNTVEIFRPGPGGPWFTAPSMSYARVWATAVRLLDGRVLVAGGGNTGSAGGGTGPTDSVELFTPENL